MDTIRQLTGGNVYVDNGKLFVLADNEYLETPTVPVINAASGLLATPVWEESIIHFTMLFEPSLVCGQLVTLESSTEPDLNGTYKVVSLRHSATISAAVAGDAVTEVGLSAPFKSTQLVAVKPEAA
jgi:hypothetical protein